MKIQTTEAVRGFNAQVELVDLALDFAAHEITDPGALDRLLQITGHRELGETFKESMRQVCITGSGWPDARPGREPGQPPDKAAASSPTKSACQHNNMVLNDSKEFAWKCADCGYVYGTPSQHSKCDHLPSSHHRYIPGLRAVICCDCGAVLTKDREVDGTFLVLSEMRTTLKQCRRAFNSLLNNGERWRGYHQASLLTARILAEDAMKRIDSIIPPSEV